MGASSLILLLSCITISLLHPLTSAQYCPYPGNFTSNSIYARNRDRILSLLPSAINDNHGFYNSTLGQGSDTVYALALCRGDLSNQSCSNCVNLCSLAIIASCPNKIEAIDFGNPSQCIVRTSNKSLFGAMDTRPGRIVYEESNITGHVNEFNQALNNLVDRLVIRTAAGNSSLKFATGEKNYTRYQNNTVYGLMQCVPSLSSVDCTRCLRASVDYNQKYFPRTRSVIILRPSCIFQHDLSPFLESSAGAEPPPPAHPVADTFAPPPPSTNLTRNEDNKSRTLQPTTIIVVAVSIFLVLTVLVCALLHLRKRKGRSTVKQLVESGTNEDLPLFDFNTIVAATDNFCLENKLGQGGFGPVYKGRLPNGQEIAVKRLAKNSGQGVVEFKNEVTLIAKLQHRNLVRLLGCCIQGEEKMLIYEYLPNKSLDSFISGSLLDWRKRFDIVLGIARGMLYLHQDSRLRVIHRDLKASNVLLDAEMNPKISDFGMARICGGDQIGANTNRVVGTYGYMAPEYAMQGLFSIKSDVFSFGVLLLEIVSGTKNSGYYRDNSMTLIGHAWDLWREGKALDIVDSLLLGDGHESFLASQMLRCIHIGLLCVEESATDRPTMSDVDFMLCNETALLPPLKQPAFVMNSVTSGPDSSSTTNGAAPSLNDVTVSSIKARCAPNNAASDLVNRRGHDSRSRVMASRGGPDLMGNAGEFPSCIGFCLLSHHEFPSPSNIIGLFMIRIRSEKFDNVDPIIRIRIKNSFLCQLRTQLVMCKSSLVVLLSCIFTSLLPLTAAQYCSYPGNFTSNSTYGTNRNRIVASLVQNVHDNVGFYNATLGQGSDTVYALGLCRGDLSNITCIYCISKASLDIKLQCPNKIEAVAYGDPYPCIIRYSNESFFGAMDSRPARFLHGASNITDHINEFDQTLNDLVDRLIIRATAGNTSLKFAMGTTNYTQDENNTVYGLMQCVPVLSSVNCSRCLRGAVDDYRSCCLRKTAVNIMRPSCFFQYDLSPIMESFGGAAPPPPAPPPARTFAPLPPSSNVNPKQDNKSSTLRPTIVIVVVVAVSISLVLTALACVLLRLRKRKDVRRKGRTTSQLLDERGTDADLPLFDLITIVAATDNFSLANKLGQGGFGPVYKGRLLNGQEIAVKRLAKNSGQGVEEFKNEVSLIAKLQHRNLVRLLGCCIQEEEKILIYEYLPNKSLDSFILGSCLDWRTRFRIVLGIARGMLYLHQDSRLRIIHRDLKASNVLLDAAMNPKISDFGMARICGGDQIEANANRVVGTFGYMAPEYAMQGLFSIKSDVFSFGVLLLEIVSGTKNSSYYQDSSMTLIGHAWDLWIEGKALDIVDPFLRDQESFPAPQVLRCIHIALLCVQEFATDRPTMSKVALMLCNETALLSPKQPAFIVKSVEGVQTHHQLVLETASSVNDVTLSAIHGR
ncbi:uncharacterized protein LOC131332952 [Rhododendron vialii]|uniref:uncharacterized protein LOC131332952 n=1 Tax=Rhododendron vialii TaxID=182163 RepID=UPI00265D61B0|nr:uncharacterized protein LOC131332952 [Rhododendron vialii]